MKARIGAHLYPDDDCALLAKTSIPVVYRLFYGVLDREGPRKEEALSWTWADIDLQRGAVRLDHNKTDDPRAWALDPSVADALRWWHGVQSEEGPPSPRVFDGIEDSERLAELFGEHLEAANVRRPELFEHNDVRRRVNIHSLRATFVTLSLASGKSEAWVQDRTGPGTARVR